VGGDIYNPSGSVSFSIGQVAYLFKPGATARVNEGVQQSYEIYLVGTYDIDFEVIMNLFPNPTDGVLTLEIPDYEHEVFSYIVFDGGGREITRDFVSTATTTINIENMPPAVYYLNVLHEGVTTVKSFKIVKK
jgi:hypothetical protein